MHLAESAFADDLDSTEVLEPKLCTAQPQECRFATTELCELSLLALLGHHHVRLKLALELDASGRWDVRSDTTPDREAADRWFLSTAAWTETV